MDETARFDLNGKSPRGTTPDQMRAIMRNVLIERFAIASHRVERNCPDKSSCLGRPMVDETGFMGGFDLGQLKSRKADVEVMVIDHIDRNPH